MNEFVFLIRNKPGYKERFTPMQQIEFQQACSSFMSNLCDEGRLVTAIQDTRAGSGFPQLSNPTKDDIFDEPGEVVACYYHIRSKDIDEAFAIAENNPEFVYSISARVEVRAVNTRDEREGL